jgi:hypothetical protein
LRAGSSTLLPALNRLRVLGQLLLMMIFWVAPAVMILLRLQAA